MVRLINPAAVLHSYEIHQSKFIYFPQSCANLFKAFTNQYVETVLHLEPLQQIFIQVIKLYGFHSLKTFVIVSSTIQ